MIRGQDNLVGYNAVNGMYEFKYSYKTYSYATLSEAMGQRTILLIRDNRKLPKRI